MQTKLQNYPNQGQHCSMHYSNTGKYHSKSTPLTQIWSISLKREHKPNRHWDGPAQDGNSLGWPQCTDNRKQHQNKGQADFGML
jgi:hypothetical protein